MNSKKIAKKFIAAREKKRKPKSKRKIIIIALIAVILVGGVLSGFAIPNFNDHEYVATVVRTERVGYSAEQGLRGKYLVYCEKADGEAIVFENTDNWLRGKVNSSDIYAGIREGETYRFRVIGFRVPLFNWYENILEVNDHE